jgi:hypothetical protein
MNEDIVKKTDLTEIRSGLTQNGKVRSVVLLGQKNGKVGETIVDLGNSILQVNPSAFWIYLDSANTLTPYNWCSQFARNLRTNNGVPHANLAKFALTTGKSLSPFKQVDNEGPPEPSAGTSIAGELVKNFEALTQAGTNGSSAPHIVLAIKNLSDYSDEMLDWLSDSLNPVFRKSKFFKGCRFVFSTQQISTREKTFFNSFGFEKVNLVEVEPVKVPKAKVTSREEGEIKDLLHAPNVTKDSSVNLPFPKSLKKNGLSPSLKKESIFITNMDIKDAEKLLSSFSEIEKKYLFLSSYPTRISRYTLEHFESARQAALSYNWLTRAKSLHGKHSSRDLLLDDEIRTAARTLHASTSPAEAEEWTTLASVLDAFHELFPLDSLHWVAINLQVLDSFDSKIIRSLFDAGHVESVLRFIEDSKDLMVDKESRFSLSEEAKIVTRRYMELSEKSCLDGFIDRVRSLWLKDQEQHKTKMAQMEVEKNNVTSEIKDTLTQVANLKDLKDNLADNFRNPGGKKGEKIYSFTTSRALIVIGLGTVGASLLSESIGSYHAACGLALTLFGFFWPNVELKREAVTAAGPRSNLAIETQHRSLNHRIGSLCNRVQVMKTNLNAVEKKLLKLGDTPPPYLEAETEGTS